MSQPNYLVNLHIQETEESTRQEEKFYQTRLFKVAVVLQLVTISFFVGLFMTREHGNAPSPAEPSVQQPESHDYYVPGGTGRVRETHSATEYMMLAVSTFWSTYKVGIVVLAIGVVFLTAIAVGLAFHFEQKQLRQEAAGLVVEEVVGQEELGQLQQLEQGELPLDDQPVSAFEGKVPETEETATAPEPESLWTKLTSMDHSDTIAMALSIYGVALMFTVQIAVMDIMSGETESPTARMGFYSALLFGFVTLQIFGLLFLALLQWVSGAMDRACNDLKARSFGMFVVLAIRFLAHLGSILVGLLTVPFILVAKWTTGDHTFSSYLNLFRRHQWSFYWNCFNYGSFFLYASRFAA